MIQDLLQKRWVCVRAEAFHGFNFLIFVCVLKCLASCNNHSTSSSLIHKYDKCTTICRLHHLLTGPFVEIFFKLVTPGNEKMFLYAVQCGFMMNKVWGKSCLQEETKQKAQCWERASQLVFTKQLMLLAVGKKRLGPKPISRPPQPLYVVDVAGFSLCQERTYSNVYGY